MKKLVTMFLALVLCVGAICVPASAYYTEVSELSWVTASAEPIGTTTCVREDEGGKTHTVYIYPEGTTFTPTGLGDIAVFRAWTLDSLNDAPAGSYAPLVMRRGP